MDQIRQVVRLVNDTIGSQVRGLYLHGSAVNGGLRPASDLDIMAVTRMPLTDRQRRSLVAGLLPISGRRAGAGARSVELIVVVESDVRPWRYPPVADLLYGDWLREQIEAAGPPPPAPMPNLAIEIPQTLAADHPLLGPPPALVFDPVPPEDLVRGCLDGIPQLLRDLPGDTRNVVLTLARIWTTVATGAIRSKDRAADWAIDRLPPEHRPVLSHARQQYLTCDYSEEFWPAEIAAQVSAHVEAVLDRITRLTAP